MTNIPENYARLLFMSVKLRGFVQLKIWKLNSVYISLETLCNPDSLDLSQQYSVWS
jgi:hypothetical protein